MDHSLEDLFEILRIVSDSRSRCGNASSNASEWCDRYDTCNECRAALIDAIERKIADEYVRLPKDADGEPIHIGDMIINPDLSNQKHIVAAITPESVYWWGEDGCHWRYSHLVHHYHEPTVEDVLREFALRVAGKECMTVRSSIVDEYAKRLRLAGDAE